jgi:hypothetical protein
MGPWFDGSLRGNCSVMWPGCRLRARNLRGVMDRVATMVTMAATMAVTMVEIMETPRQPDQVSQTVLRRTSCP